MRGTNHIKNYKTKQTHRRSRVQRQREMQTYTNTHYQSEVNTYTHGEIMQTLREAHRHFRS